jgi:hypothetical protein
MVIWGDSSFPRQKKLGDEHLCNNCTNVQNHFTFFIFECLVKNVLLFPQM